MTATLGKAKDGRPVAIDVERLIASRMLLTARSGGGKSWALRRILEQTHGQVQQIVIDTEGEFYTLRERFDYILAGHEGGDCAAEPKSSALLARRILELGTSAICDIYELRPRERMSFVRRFLESLIDAPRKLWRPVLVVIDEANVYAPESGGGKGSAPESLSAVCDLMARGRKRGFAGLLATQRLSKLHKDAAAEAGNLLVGGATLDTDVKRAGDLLGFSKPDAQRVRKLRPGEFFAFGPAISDEVVQLSVGTVATKHPKGGASAPPVPPPKAQVLNALSDLADLQAEAEEEASTVDSLQQQVKERDREIRELRRAKPEPDPAELAEVSATAFDEGVSKARAGLLSQIQDRDQEIDAAIDKLRAILRSPIDVDDLVQRHDSRNVPGSIRAKSAQPTARATSSRADFISKDRNEAADVDLSGPEQRIVNALGELHALGIENAPRKQVALFAGYTNVASKGFSNSISSLSTGGMIEFERGGPLALTDAGLECCNCEAPRSTEELHNRVLSMLKGALARMLSPLLDAYPESMTKTTLMEATGYTNAASKGFSNSLSRLNSLGLIQAERGADGNVRAAEILFL